MTSPPLDAVPLPRATDRLRLRRATAADAEALWPYRSDPTVAEWLTHLPTERAAFDEWLASDEALDGMLLVERDGVVVGDLYLSVRDGWSQRDVAEQAARTEAEVGWVIAPGHQGRGYAREAIEALLSICFEDLGIRRVTAGCFTANEASWRLMERVGMRRESHTVRDALHRDHGWLDGFSYGLLADEWRERRRG